MAATGHSYTTEVTEPTCTKPGYTTYTCACGDSYVADEVKELGHNYTAVVTAPTCTADGYTTHTCTRCNDSYTDSEVKALGHTYDITYTWTKTADGYTVTATADCSRGDVTVTETVTATYAETKVPGCEATGLGVWTATFKNTLFATQTKEVEVEATGHSYTAVVTPATCTTPGYTTYTCACGDSYVADEVKELGHNYTAVVTAPTCTADGYTTHTCTRCNDSYTDSEVKALGHKYDITYTWTKTADGYTVTATADCKACDNEAGSTVTETATVKYEVVTKPGCEATGVGVWTATFENKLFATQTKEVVIPATGHTEVIDPAKAATCTQTGLTEGKHCSECDKVLVAQKDVPALGHNYKVTYAWTQTADGYTVTATADCSRCDAETGSTVTETVTATYKEVTAADCVTTGVGVWTASFTNDLFEAQTTTITIPALGHTYGEWISVLDGHCFHAEVEERTCSVCGDTEQQDGTDFTCPTEIYTDVDQLMADGTDNWYHAGVDFCRCKGLMIGMSDTYFGVEEAFTRAHIVTVLYRMAGSPSVEGLAAPTFTDIEADQYYYDAVVWGCSKGIIKGYSDTAFGPHDEVTREQTVTFFGRYAEWQHVYDASAEVDITAFADDEKVSDWAYDYMEWCVGEGIIEGMGNNDIQPQSSALRSQGATIMMRYCMNILDWEFGFPEN